MVDPDGSRRRLNPNRTYNVYFYDSVAGGGRHYDHAIVSPVGKTGRRRRWTSRWATSSRSSSSGRTA